MEEIEGGVGGPGTSVASLATPRGEGDGVAFYRGPRIYIFCLCVCIYTRIQGDSETRVTRG